MAIAMLSTGVERPELISVLGEGSSFIEEDNYLAAREAAQTAALHQAIWKVVRTLLPQESVDESREAIRIAIVTRQSDFIQSYKFINEYVDEENHRYNLDVQFTFFIEHIRQAVEQAGFKLEEGSTRQKVLLLFDERLMGMVPDASFLLLQSTVEETISASFERMGYHVINRAEIRKLNNSAKALEAIRGNKDAVKWLAEQFKTTYLVLGTAKSTTHKDGSSAGPWVDGEIDARVYDGLTAYPLWQDKSVKSLESRDGTASFSAIRMAAEELGGKLEWFIHNRVTAE